MVRGAFPLPPLKVGQEVVVANNPSGARTRVVERCKVTQGLVPVRDPGKANPSTLEVKSFEIDCKTVQHGSSGAPVFDPGTIVCNCTVVDPPPVRRGGGCWYSVTAASN